MNIFNRDLLARGLDKNTVGKENENKTREYNYKKKTGSSKSIPSYATVNQLQNSPSTDSENIILQQSKIIAQEQQKNSTSGKGKASRTSAKCPPISTDNSLKKEEVFNDIRKSKTFPEKQKFQPPAQQPVPQKPKPTRPTVSFAVPPQPPKEAFRPPTPVSFMHRVNSLPYVAVTEDDSAFLNDPQPTDPFDIQVPFDETSFYQTPANSRPFTPVERSTPNPTFLPIVDLPETPPSQYFSSGSSRQMSPSLRDRSPSLPILIPKIPWYRKWKKQFIIVIVCILILILAGQFV